MARLRFGLLALLIALVSAGDAFPAPPAPQNVRRRTITAPTPQPLPRSIAEPVNPPFPGGGRILFMYQQGPGYPTDGVGVAAADGSTRYFGHDEVDAMWDPSARSRVLFEPGRDGAALRWYRLGDGEWDAVGRTKVEGAAYFARVSPDGRLIAYNHFRHGRETKEIRVVDRAGLPRGRLSGWRVAGWADRWHVLVGAWGLPGDLYLWDVRQPDVRLFLSGTTLTRVLPAASGSMYLDTSSMSWSPDRGLFALPIGWSEGRTNQGAVVVGSSSGAVLAIVRLGHRDALIPTWSPVRSLLAIPSVGRHDRSEVELYDVTSGRRMVLTRSGGWPWAAWSPSGRWLLVPDARHSRWLFLSGDGHKQIPYPWLGSTPRWSGSPGVDVHVPLC